MYIVYAYYSYMLFLENYDKTEELFFKITRADFALTYFSGKFCTPLYLMGYITEALLIRNELEKFKNRH